MSNLAHTCLSRAIGEALASRGRRRALICILALVALSIQAVPVAADSWNPGPGAQQGASIVGFVDQPGARTSVFAGSETVVGGWVVDSSARGWTGVDRVEIYDGPAESGEFLGAASIGIQRTDVAQAYGYPYWADSGFRFRLDTSILRPGLHNVYVYAGTPARGWWSTTVTLNVVPDYVFQVISAPRDDQTFYCLSANPSCGRDEWWVEWNDIGSDDLVQYAFVGPGLVTEQRFVEAIWLIWQWPAGKNLLRAAANSGVLIESDAEAEGFGYFVPSEARLAVNQGYTEVSTWMLADVLVHELRHAFDTQAGLYQGRSYAACIIREVRAFRDELRYLRWIRDRFGYLPSVTAIQDNLSRQDQAMYADLLDSIETADLTARVQEMYQDQCGSL
jgi:hypothetical protein